MTQVLEYITENYTLFLFGAIIILLAVIGYYAEKTNFGQGKADKTKDEKTKNKEINLNNIGLMDVTNEIENNIQTNVENNDQKKTEELVHNEENLVLNVDSAQNLFNNESTNEEKGSSKNNENLTELENKKIETVNPIIDAIHKELNLVSNDAIFDVEKIKDTETKNKEIEEEFIKFSNEFDEILPEREIISDDLLSEIDDLELGKTQKFNLKDFKRFDNIKLPRISETVTEDQEIWKF